MVSIDEKLILLFLISTIYLFIHFLIYLFNYLFTCLITYFFNYSFNHLFIHEILIRKFNKNKLTSSGTIFLISSAIHPI